MIRLRMLLCLLAVLSLSSVAHAEYASPGIVDGTFISSLFEGKGVALTDFSAVNGKQVDVAIIGGNTAWGGDAVGKLVNNVETQLTTLAQSAGNGWYYSGPETRNVAFNSLYFKSENPHAEGQYFTLTDNNLLGDHNARFSDPRKALVAFELTSTLTYNGRDYGAGTILVCFEDMVYQEGADYDYNDMIVAITTTPTPIPAAAWMLGSGLAGLLALRRRNQ